MKFLVTILLLAAAAPLWSQHEHMAMPQASAARLSSALEGERLVARLGPLDLPAHTAHMQTPQPPPQWLVVPFDGWITAYHPELVDGAGNKLPSRLLHHVAFWNSARSDFLCPNKEEHIFGAGGELNDWPALPGFGYRVHKGDRIRVTTMFHNPTGTSYPRAWLVVRMEYQQQGPGPGLKNVYPAWFDVQKCGDSGFAVPAAGLEKSADIPLNFSGRLLGVGGHMHDYGDSLALVDTTQQQPVATLKAELDAQGHIRAMPIVTFVERGGFPLKRGDLLKVTGRYDKPGREGADGMAIVVGYFLPDADEEMKALVRH